MPYSQITKESNEKKPYRCENCGKHVDDFVLEITQKVFMAHTENSYSVHFSIDNKRNNPETGDIDINFCILCPDCLTKFFVKFIEAMKNHDDSLSCSTAQTFHQYMNECTTEFVEKMQKEFENGHLGNV